MTRERFEQVKQTANRMAAEIEWADFPNLADAEMREVLTAMALDPDVLPALRETLAALFRVIEQMFDRLPGHQEIELEAAGMVQAALKDLIRRIAPEAVPLLKLPIRTKFRGWGIPIVQAPPDVFVPSAGEQLAGRRPYRPAQMN